ncbi:MAG: hypothetical protein Q8R08_00190 [bacterium]|nr:hypothetical protein [bacterium]
MKTEKRQLANGQIYRISILASPWTISKDTELDRILEIDTGPRIKIIAAWNGDGLYAIIEDTAGGLHKVRAEVICEGVEGLLTVLKMAVKGLSSNGNGYNNGHEAVARSAPTFGVIDRHPPVLGKHR